MRRLILSLAFAIATAWPAGAPYFVVIVHSSNLQTDLHFTDLRNFFAGGAKTWRNGARVVLVERNLGSAAYNFLLGHVLNMSATDYKRRLASIEFAGETPVTLKVLNSEEASCKFVFNVPGSIALIEAQSLRAPECGGVQIVRIDGKLPGEEGYRLQ